MDNVICTATRYGLECAGIESNPGNGGGGGGLFPASSSPVLGPPHPPDWYGVIPEGNAGRGVQLTTHPHPASKLNKEYSYTSTPPSQVIR